jgi:hypothetical protein
VICTGTLLVLVGNPYQAGINSLAWTLCVQELWLSTSVTAGKLPVSLVAQCETMSDGPSRGTRNRRPILPQIVFMSNIEIEEEEWKPVEFCHCSLVKSVRRALRIRDSGITTVCIPSLLQRSSIGSLSPYLLRASRLWISDLRWSQSAGANEAMISLR